MLRSMRLTAALVALRLLKGPFLGFQRSRREIPLQLSAFADEQGRRGHEECVRQNGWLKVNVDRQRAETDYRFYGRVLHGSAPDNFRFLSHPDKAHAWIFGSDALECFVRRSPLEILRTLGYHDGWILQKVEDGCVFKMVIFPMPSEHCVRATWESVFRLARMEDPTCAQDFCRWAPQLKAAYPSIARDGLHGLVHKALARGIHSRNAYQPNPTDAEGFRRAKDLLVQRMGVNEYFTGDGYTMNMNDGKAERGVREYLMPNLKIEDIPGALILDLPLCSRDLPRVHEHNRS